MNTHGVIRSDRTIKKGKTGFIFILFYQFPENTVVFPKPEHLVFQIDKIYITVDRFKLAQSPQKSSLFNV